MGRSSFAGFGRIANFSNSMGQSDVKASIPVLGVFQWVATRPGLEAIGGVTIGSILGGLVERGLMERVLGVTQISQKPLANIGSGLLTAVLAWELGRLIGSANIAKFGALFALGSKIKDMLVDSVIFDSILPHKTAMGQLRIPEGTQLPQLSQLRIPEGQELVGMGQMRIPEGTELPELSQEITTEEELLGQFEEEGDEESDLF